MLYSLLQVKNINKVKIMNYSIKYAKDGYENSILIGAQGFGEAVYKFCGMKIGEISSVTRLPFTIEDDDAHAQAMHHVEDATDLFCEAFTERDKNLDALGTIFQQLEASKYMTDDKRIYIEQQIIKNMTDLLVDVLEYIND